MTRTPKALAVIASMVFCAAAAAAQSTDADAVKAVVQSAYIEGVHVNMDAAKMRQGFHPDFRMLMLRDGKLTQITLEEWIGRMETNAKQNPNGPKPAIKADFPIVDVTGNEAVVKVEVYRDGKHAFTDYLFLYKFPDGWKIVSKIFQSYS
jgi:ketosteroid isomerase-like protein